MTVLSRTLVVVALLACFARALTFAADSPAAVNVGEQRSPRDASTDNESDSPGLQLAQEHLVELLPVLDHLRDHEPEQYDKAVRDLNRAARRLESLQRRDAALHAMALREWQTRGRMDLLKARLRVRRSDADAQQLRTQMRLLREIEIQRLGRERELLTERESLMRQRAAQARQAAEKARRQIELLDRQLARMATQPAKANSATESRTGSPSRNLGRPAAPAPTIVPPNPSVPTKPSRASQ